MAQYYNKVSYGLSEPLILEAVRPIIALRNPLASDISYPLGTLWINRLTNASFILTSVVANAGSWVNMALAGGQAFTTLTSTLATTLGTAAGAVSTFGNIGAGSSASILGGTGAAGVTINGAPSTNITIGASLTTGLINIGGASQTGMLTIAGGTATQTINIANSTGGKVLNLASGAGVNVVTLGSVTGASGTTIQAGTAGLHLNAAGITTMESVADTQASPTAVSVINANVGSATFTGFTTAAAASQVFTITNSLVSATSQLFVSAANEGAADAQMTITRVNRGAGTFSVTLLNNGAAALDGNVTITFWIIG